MEMALFTFVMFMLGAALGSFAVASVWRLRAWQLASDKKQGEVLSKSERAELSHLAKLRGKSTTKDRSLCLHCGRQLKAKDLIPVLSWVWLRGKCRECKQPIGRTELFAEIGLGVAVALSFTVWPFGFAEWYGVALFVIWVLLLTLLTIHIVYDAKWFLLLDTVTLAILALALGFVSLQLFAGSISATWEQALAIGLSLLVLPGFYGLLYVISKGQWIGFGDVKLLVPLALLLASWPHALLVLFLANVLGCLWILPGMLAKKVTRTTRIPFGPFLILAWAIAMLWGTQIIEAYMGTMLF